MKKIVSLITVCALLVLALVPATALAASEATEESKLRLAANDGGTFKMTKDIELHPDADNTTGILWVMADQFTLDLNGHKLTGADTEESPVIIAVADGSTLTITDSSVTESPMYNLETGEIEYECTGEGIGCIEALSPIGVADGGSVVLKNGMIRATDKRRDSFSAIAPEAAEKEVSVRIEGGIIESETYALSIEGGTTLDLSGGVVLSHRYMAIEAGAFSDQKNKLTISGTAAIIGSAECDAAIDMAWTTGVDLRMTGGTVYNTGGCGICVNGGNISFTGGVIETTATEDFNYKDHEYESSETIAAMRPSPIVLMRNIPKNPDAENVELEIGPDVELRAADGVPLTTYYDGGEGQDDPVLSVQTNGPAVSIANGVASAQSGIDVVAWNWLPEKTKSASCRLTGNGVEIPMVPKDSSAANLGAGGPMQLIPNLEGATLKDGSWDDIHLVANGLAGGATAIVARNHDLSQEQSIALTVTGTPKPDPIEVKPGVTGVAIESIEGLGNCAAGEALTATEGGLTANEVLGMFTAPAEDADSLRIVHAAGAVLTSDQIVGTGAMLELAGAQSETDEVTIIIRGDVLGNGKMSLTQLVRLTLAFRSPDQPLTGAYLAAGDFDSNGTISLNDVVHEAALYVSECLTN